MSSVKTPLVVRDKKYVSKKSKDQFGPSLSRFFYQFLAPFKITRWIRDAELNIFYEHYIPTARLVSCSLIEGKIKDV